MVHRGPRGRCKSTLRKTASAVLSVAALLSFAVIPAREAHGASVEDYTREDIRSIVVDLSEQRTYITTASGRRVVVLISSGASSTPTRAGSYKITSKTRVGTSGGDKRVHMDFFSRFDRGIGFHGIPWRGNRSNRLWTPLGKKGVSHGCVRMPDTSAAWIYQKAPVGTTVVVQK